MAVDNRIEQETVINASLDRVWDLVSQPGWWVPTDVEAPVDRTPGTRSVRDSKEWGRHVLEVVQIEPQTYVAFRWSLPFSGEDLAAGRTTLVEFFIKPSGDAVNVTVIESGFATLDVPEEARRSEYSEHTEGWQEELGGLKARAESVAAA